MSVLALKVALERHRLTYCVARHRANAQHVLEVLEAIHASPWDRALCVNALRRRCGVGDHNVSITFKREVGCSIMEYVKALRVEAAAACLRCNSWTVADVADAVGFTSLQSFYVAFKRIYGTTPAVYRTARGCHAAPFRRGVLGGQTLAQPMD
jgi:two-component system, response regulator YesN